MCCFDTGSGARHGLWQPHMGRHAPSSDSQRAGSSGAMLCTLVRLRALKTPSWLRSSTDCRRIAVRSLAGSNVQAP